MKLLIDSHSAYAYTGGKTFDPERPCVVFVHGALHDHSVWTLLARWFAHHGCSVLALDLPGHGRSEGQALPSIEALGAWLWRVLDGAGASQATLLGHSMGSLIALAAAAQAPQRCQQLVMVGTAYPMKVSEALLNTAREQPLKAIDMVNVFSHSRMASKPSYPGPGSWLQGGNRQLMRRMQTGYTHGNLFEHDFKVCDGYAGGLDAAARVHCPVRFILGAHDQMTQARQARALAQALNAQVSLLPCGHALMTEVPELLLATLREVIPTGVPSAASVHASTQ